MAEVKPLTDDERKAIDAEMRHVSPSIRNRILRLLSVIDARDAEVGQLTAERDEARALVEKWIEKWNLCAERGACERCMKAEAALTDGAEGSDWLQANLPTRYLGLNIVNAAADWIRKLVTEVERLTAERAQASQIIARFCDEECPVNTEEFGGHLPNPQDCYRGCPCIGRDIWRVFTAATDVRAALAEKE